MVRVEDWPPAHGNGDESLQISFWKELFQISQNPHLSEKVQTSKTYYIVFKVGWNREETSSQELSGLAEVN